MRKRSHAEILEERLSPSEMTSTTRYPLILILNNIRSMHNVGSIFRTSDAACIQQVYLTGYTAQPPRPEIEKTALGATETVPWTYEKNITTVISDLKAKDITIIGLEQTTDSISLYDYVIKDRVYALILGNEIFGIDDDVIPLLDDAIEIPMHGMKHSLNVSVAAGIAVFELIKPMRKR